MAVGVIDVGKSNAKVAAVDLDAMREAGVLTAPNRVLRAGPYPHYDVEGLWGFMLDGLARLHRAHGIEALTVTTHGAAAALLDKGGGLAAPVIDYEHDGPDELAAAYDAIRPDFAETGSPRLPMGLNLGAQIFWQLETQPGLAARLGHVLTWPQYWVWRLSGAMASEMTSLGCHTDLWDPAARRFSSLVERLGIGGAMAPVAKAADRVGRLLPEIAARTGLDPATPVHCGIHDSNASLYPHLLRRQAPFAVVSTGTWVIAMAIGGREAGLDPARDTLINVDAFGDPVPSGRFMGGREFETVGGGRLAEASEAEAASVVERGLMLLPSVEPSSGPFQGRRASWIADAAGLGDGERFAALSFYVAMMTATCLEMIGAAGAVVTEGPFARNRLYLAMLAAALGRPVTGGAESATGTSVGAAMLTRGAAPVCGDADADEVAPSPRLAAYASAWRAAARA
jgi:sugar (pentulose or hexulose) kinase